jgi:phosphohistidine phosphatase
VDLEREREATRTLLVVRHAKSDRGAAGSDHDRPLNGRGRRDAPALGRWLAEHAPAIDVVLCSSAARAQQTWRLAAAELTGPPPPDVRPSLYLAGRDSVLTQLRDVEPDARVVVLVGHEPTQSALTSYLVGAAEPAAAQLFQAGFTTSAVAVLRLPGAWAALAPRTCRLIDFAVPRG